MAILDFQYRTVSPLFLYGAGSALPELRAPSFKGMLRFWWRAVQAEDDIQELRRREGEIFGGTGTGEGRSSFSLRIKSGAFGPVMKSLLPHHDLPTYRGQRRPKVKAIVNHSFQLILSYRDLPQGFSPDHLRALVELSALLGGVGKRSRRGFGCFQIMACNGKASELLNLAERVSLRKAVLDRMNLLSGGRYGESDQIIRLREKCSAHYPYVEEIRIGEGTRNLDVLLTTVGSSSHGNDCGYTGMGGPRGRLASPEYVSIVRGGAITWPVITSLHPVFDPKKEKPTADKREEFRAAILGGAGET
ncbi:CRISPR-associated protein Cmr1 [Acididesulfobacillus acetoxydans]|uniref:CRISPR-associated protein Cmr1 n=1 Tax=Acididesulfobacillus acetoxydans TaxID=1561005 RepID=A0A8S0Y046_9FIRM|nr:type III-B CRISPR module RAMP protein Cmr1 [Acididesulfobacillus acetoxydans]CAA7602817.1 CRISPR-associated protein Cmr1 [Acididesulfobacillus acetoxydans]CEJ06014.1 cas_TM1795_cmr1: CRISPR type III-B/RAMP module RAMP protein Cmr1 [Acididesulfobacillus acetoxydans]